MPDVFQMLRGRKEVHKASECDADGCPIDRSPGGQTLPVVYAPSYRFHTISLPSRLKAACFCFGCHHGDCAKDVPISIPATF